MPAEEKPLEPSINRSGLSARNLSRPRQPSEDHSLKKPKAIQENKLNAFFLNQIRGKANPQNRSDLSYSSKVSDRSNKVSDKSANSQIKKNSLNTTKITLNTS